MLLTLHAWWSACLHYQVIQVILHYCLCKVENTLLATHNCIECFVYTGLLESVSDLTVTRVNSSTVLISWSPPFTLEGVPILGYNVTVTNTTSVENETMSVEEDTTMLYYSINTFWFTITIVSTIDRDNRILVTVTDCSLGMGTPSRVKGGLQEIRTVEELTRVTVRSLTDSNRPV